MKKGQFTEQIIGVLKEYEAGLKASEQARNLPLEGEARRGERRAAAEAA